LILFSLTVVSFLLLDRDVDFVTAMITSVRAVVTSDTDDWLGCNHRCADYLGAAGLPGLLVTLPAGSYDGISDASSPIVPTLSSSTAPAAASRLIIAGTQRAYNDVVLAFEWSAGHGRVHSSSRHILMCY
jgi:hypothetical protein